VVITVPFILADWVVGYGMLSSSLIGVIVSPDVGDQQAREGHHPYDARRLVTILIAGLRLPA
jgi:hypothetical protein